MLTRKKALGLLVVGWVGMMGVTRLNLEVPYRRTAIPCGLLAFGFVSLGLGKVAEVEDRSSAARVHKTASVLAFVVGLFWLVAVIASE